MEHVIARYLRHVWEMSGWLYEGQHGFRPGYSCESQVVAVCQDIADSLDKGVRTDAIIIDFSKAFTKIETTGVDLRVVVWVKEFLLGRSQKVRVDGQLSEEVRVTSGVLQGSLLGPLLFLDDCIIYRKITDSKDIENLQQDLNILGEWVVENEMKINPDKSKAVSFTKARVKERTRYYFGEQLIPEASIFKYLGIIIRNDLNWADHVNYTL